MNALIYAVLASIVYMFAYWLPKRIKESDEQKIAPKKVIRTVIWGILVGAVAWYMGVEPTLTGIQGVTGMVMGYSVLVGIVDKATLFVYRVYERSPLYYKF